MKILKSISWQSVFKVLLTLMVEAVLLYTVIPFGFSQYNEIRSLRDARRNRAVKFGELNTEFNRKVNATKTLLLMFADHNQRIRLSSFQVPDAQKDLYRSYEQWRLDLDEVAWWGASEFLREAGALDLLSEDEKKQLQGHLGEYSKSVLRTVNQVTALWNFFDSPKYRMDKGSDTEKKKIEAEADRQMGLEYDIRANLVNSVASLFLNSTHRTNQYNKIGL